MKRANHPPIVFVEWRDAATATARWEDREKTISLGLSLATDPVTAAGFLLADAQDTIVLGLLLNHHNDDAGHVVAIPKGAVVRMTEVRKARGWVAK